MVLSTTIDIERRSLVRVIIIIIIIIGRKDLMDNAAIEKLSHHRLRLYKFWYYIIYSYVIQNGSSGKCLNLT